MLSVILTSLTPMYNEIISMINAMKCKLYTFHRGLLSIPPSVFFLSLSVSGLVLEIKKPPDLLSNISCFLKIAYFCLLLFV